MSSKISDLFKAIASRDVDELRNLLNSDRSLTNKENEQGLIPLGFAAHFGNRDCVQILLHFNVKIDNKTLFVGPYLCTYNQSFIIRK